MEKYYEMIAVHRRDGNIVLSTLNGSKTFSVSEINLKSFGVSLGDMVKVFLDSDNTPTEFIRIDNHGYNFDVRGGYAIVEGHCAMIMLENNRYYFNSPIFGEMNSVGVISPDLKGTSQLVRISYRSESSGLPFNWDAYIDYAEPISKIEKGKNPIREYAPFTVEGIVVAKNEKRNYYYVWNVELYPGKYIHLYPKPGVDVKVSDWVRMYFTELHYEMCFPLDATPDLPQCESILFVKIEPRFQTVAINDDSSVMITIPNFVKQGDKLYHYYFGYLRDDEKYLEEDGTFEITVTRRTPNEPCDSEIPGWYINNATKLNYTKQTKVRSRSNINSVQKIFSLHTCFNRSNGIENANPNDSAAKLNKLVQFLDTNEGQSSSHRSPSEVPHNLNTKPPGTIPINGIIVGKNDRSNCYYVWTKESYPGKEVKLWNNMGIDLRVSDWVQMHLTQTERQQYFPLEPTPDTPQFQCRSFTKIDHRLSTFPTNKTVLVEIRGFVKSEGDTLYDHHLGYLRDDEDYLTENGSFDLIVARRAPAQTSCGQTTVWQLISAKRRNEFD